jgi:hypothetical protein
MINNTYFIVSWNIEGGSELSFSQLPWAENPITYSGLNSQKVLNEPRNTIFGPRGVKMLIFSILRSSDVVVAPATPALRVSRTFAGIHPLFHKALMFPCPGWTTPRIAQTSMIQQYLHARGLFKARPLYED